MNLDVVSYDAAEVSDGTLDAVYEATMRMFAVDRPGQALPARDAFVGRLRTTATDYGPRLNWTIHLGDELVGTGFAILPEAAENRTMAIAEVRVVPDRRRRGIGTAALKAVLPQLRARGRDRVSAYGVAVGEAGHKWAGELGFETVHATVEQELEIAAVDPARWSVAAPRGFSAVRWAEAAPDGLLDSFAAARNAIRDAPRGESSFAAPAWTAERVREHEAAVQARGVEQRVVAALHDGTGAIAGLTVLEVQPHDRDMALQQDTAVLAGYRGHGLGRFMKSEMMRWLLADHPDVKRVWTQTAADNVHMIRVNGQLGYTTMATYATVEADIAKLMSRS
jgi:GNAT superfamily N-acetyltransferase